MGRESNLAPTPPAPLSWRALAEEGEFEDPLCRREVPHVQTLLKADTCAVDDVSPEPTDNE